MPAKKIDAQIAEKGSLWWYAKLAWPAVLGGVLAVIAASFTFDVLYSWVFLIAALIALGAFVGFRTVSKFNGELSHAVISGLVAGVIPVVWGAFLKAGYNCVVAGGISCPSAFSVVQELLFLSIVYFLFVLGAAFTAKLKKVQIKE